MRLSVDDIKKRKENLSEAEKSFDIPAYIVPHRRERNIVKFCYSYGFDPDDPSVMHDIKENRVVFPIVLD